MSWLARSIADTLNLNDEPQPDPNPPNPSSPRGVKEDLTEIKQTLSRQFWGVASFLSPPSQSPTESGRSSAVNESGIKTDLLEIGGRFRSGISKLSGNIKSATEYLQKAVEEMNEETARNAVGVSEEVVAFVKDLAMHPDTWLDFPLSEEDDEEEEFDMSDAQQEHALAVERLVPSLAALRMELCPEYISESFFWKIYFVLLHPKLDKEVAVILSTPQVMEARALLTTELQKVKQNNNFSPASVDHKDGPTLQHEVSLSVPSGPPENSTQNVEVPKLDASTEAPNTSIDIQVVDKSATSSTASDSQTDKHQIVPSEIQIVDKSVIEEQNLQSGSSNTWDNRDDEDDDHDDWLKEEISELGGGVSETTNIPIENDDDVSFSDLEDNDEDAPTTTKKVNYTSDKDSRDWVQL